ncbi:hypothetical protein IQK56_15635 [Pseudomonas sp. MAFF 301449]|uniref:Replication protein n=1 Tax=Pseudomonas cyclaminis TaxID=2781239 RepID=A0ABR9SUW8_9PSED|nr:hypothetical protein [Pseudomonas cyclaminis]MBE8592251.1 hypothetical protein [Pseudomonas cyclaminis]MBE8600784.1 hypothetical protein [Pseudomonas cyclaminis]
MAYAFSKLLTGWTRENGCDLRAFPAGPSTGASISALKCLLAIAVQADFKTDSAIVSYNDFETLTGLSRPMIRKGLDVLSDLKLIRVQGGYAHKYTVQPIKDTYWAKIPTELLKRNLKDIGNRGVVCLGALKIYILLAARRNNDYDWTAQTYEHLEQATGVRRADIRACLSMLYSARLLHADTVTLEGRDQFQAYFIRGLTIKDPRLGRTVEEDVAYARGRQV